MTYPNFNMGDVLASSDMNAVGLWKITDLTASFTGGTPGSVNNGTVTIGAGNSAVAVASAFSSNYQNYVILVSGGVGSTAQSIRLQLGSSITGYYYGAYGWRYDNVGALGIGEANAANFARAGFSTADNNFLNCTLYGPQLAKKTGFTAQYAEARSVAGSGGANVSGFHDVATAYTGFTISVGGTMTGGTIRVYGLRD